MRVQNRREVVALGVIVMIVVICLLDTVRSSRKTATATTPTSSTVAVESSSVQSSPAATTSPETRQGSTQANLKRLMSAIFGDRLRDVGTIENVDGGWNVLVSFTAHESWTAKTTADRIESEMRQAYEALFTSGEDIRTAGMFAHASVRDEYGRKSDALVYKTTMDAATAKGIVWKDADALDFTELWRTGFKNRSFDQ